VATLRLVSDVDVPLHRLADRLREVGHWVPPDPLERAIDAAIQATPPELLVAVRTHLRGLGSEDGPEERVMFAKLLDLFVERAPGTLARLEALVDAGHAAAAVRPARRLAGQAEALGAVPLARLCGGLAAGAEAGDAVVPAATRAALRRELAVTCRVLAALAAQLSGTSRAVAASGGRRDAGA
jgi:hypothetical protein